MLGLSTFTAACSIGNEIDTCRPAPSEVAINQRIEGWRMSPGLHAIATLRGGGALAVFHSALDGSRNQQSSEIRGTLLARNGERRDTCSESYEYTYDQPDGARPVQQLVGPSIAAPLHDTDPGLIVYARYDASALDEERWIYTDRRGQVFGRLVDEYGCPFSGTAPFQISDEPDDYYVNIPEVVRLGDAYVVIWMAMPNRGADYRLRARVLSYTFGPVFETAVDALTGAPTIAPVNLRPAGEMPIGYGAVALSEEIIAVAWMTTNADAAQDATWLAVYDKQLRPRMPEPIELHTSKAMASTPWNTFPALAFDGERLLVVWSQSNNDELSRIYGALFTWNGEQLERTRGAFRIGSASVGDEGRASVTTAGPGRFVVAWEEKNSSADGDASGASIRMTALDGNGDRLFVNPACNALDFQLNRALAGDQTNVSIASGDDYTIQAVWTDNGVSDGNPRGAAMIRSLSLTYEQLFSDTVR